MSLPQLSSKSKKLKFTEKNLKIDLAEMFSGVLKEERKKNSFDLARINFNRVLEFNSVRPRTRIKTQKILNQFEEFLRVFEK